jgi:hypothetical protein
MPSTDKLIVTNLSALKKKYRMEVQHILDAVKGLIAADKDRGLRTQLLGLDDVHAMRALRATPVTTAGDRRQVKTAIDDVFRTLRPDYVVILGSYDVVPHQRLKNPMFHHDDDDDQFVPSDLPYACEAPYSIQCRDFRGPTRIVGRVPDLTRESDPRYLVGLLKTAASWVRRPRDQYADYFGVSAQIWAQSTALSLANTFGASGDLKLVPPEDYHWPAALLKRRAHFINCHGAPGKPFFYGQPKSGKEEFPEAHSAAHLKGRVTQGTVVAAECCYGAELYPPHVANGQPGICNTYLQESAYGFFGSSTIAYGPSSGNGEADYICQFFRSTANVRTAGDDSRPQQSQDTGAIQSHGRSIHPPCGPDAEGAHPHEDVQESLPGSDRAAGWAAIATPEAGAQRLGSRSDGCRREGHTWSTAAWKSASGARSCGTRVAAAQRAVCHVRGG